MNLTREDPARLLRRLAWTGAALACGLILLGGVVRITGSGMGCGDHWPRCDGEWFPPLDLATLIEISHRWVAALVSLFVLAIAAVAWRRHRADRSLRDPAALAAVLLVLQVLLGAITVKLALPPWVIITHLANAMILLAVLIMVALRAGQGRPGEGALPRTERHAAHGLVHATTGLGFVVILFGAQTANFHAGLLCLGFPFCSDSALPPAAPLALLPWAHRMLAFAFLALVITLVVRLRQYSPDARPLWRAAQVTLGATLLQVGIAAAMVLHLLPAGLRALHLLVGTLVWASLVVLVFRSSRTRAGARVRASKADRRPSLAADLVTLTKPRIISLLLVTTIAPMFITPAGLPSPVLVLWVTIGGYLMAGGANAINMWFDRDIDDLMARTRLRPIPAGRISPALGLGWGISLAAVAFAMLWFLVNPLSAGLALAGLLFYVFIYTVWLKRSSPQNIVIGGAAGAFPPLVGWAAVTGRLDLAAIYLFAIIFYWTPPHFWALALIKQADYARAGIPMMPVAYGAERTKYEMLVYTLMLIPLTIMPTLFGALGPIYGLAAVLLGARLLWYCIKLRRERTVTPLAWGMYKYSLLYLALLFAAMGVDRAFPLGTREPDPSKVIIFNNPGEELATPVGIHLGH
ncbi:MAG: protoheme IX farnesyltransferase [Gemmatimonadales bacterium]|nr:protoheme IX farnesyltransferase [Gemmatimonadales bacterium]